MISERQNGRYSLYQQDRRILWGVDRTSGFDPAITVYRFSQINSSA